MPLYELRLYILDYTGTDGNFRGFSYATYIAPERVPQKHSERLITGEIAGFFVKFENKFKHWLQVITTY